VATYTLLLGDCATKLKLAPAGIALPSWSKIVHLPMPWSYQTPML
jgi:hypothetical protein